MKKIIIILLLVLPSIGYSQYRTMEDSLLHMKNIYDDYHMVNNDVGCFMGGGSFTAMASVMFGLILSKSGDETEQNIAKSILIGGVVSGASFITISLVMRQKHKPKYVKYRKHYGE